MAIADITAAALEAAVKALLNMSRISKWSEERRTKSHFCRTKKLHLRNFSGCDISLEGFRDEVFL